MIGAAARAIPLAWARILAFAVPSAVLVLVARRRRLSLIAARPAPSPDVCGPCDSEPGESQEKPLAPPPAVSPQSDNTPRKALLGGSPRDIGLSKDPTATSRRENYIDWHDYFMSVAMLSAFRSKDPNKQVGACIVDPKRQRIVGIGYNGFPWGCSDEVLPWARKAPSILDTKNPYVCHAEMNAIFNKNSSSLEGCRIYTTLFPCNECTKMIIQSRLSDVVYLSDEKHGEDSMVASRRMLELAGIPAWAHKPSTPRIVIDFDSDLAR